MLVSLLLIALALELLAVAGIIFYNRGRRRGQLDVIEPIVAAQQLGHEIQGELELAERVARQRSGKLDRAIQRGRESGRSN